MVTIWVKVIFVDHMSWLDIKYSLFHTSSLLAINLLDPDMHGKNTEVENRSKQVSLSGYTPIVS